MEKNHGAKGKPNDRRRTCVSPQRSTASQVKYTPESGSGSPPLPALWGTHYGGFWKCKRTNQRRPSSRDLFRPSRFPEVVQVALPFTTNAFLFNRSPEVTIDLPVLETPLNLLSNRYAGTVSSSYIDWLATQFLFVALRHALRNFSFAIETMASGLPFNIWG